jgi:hypothetical protein
LGKSDFLSLTIRNWKVGGGGFLSLTTLIFSHRSGVCHQQQQPIPNPYLTPRFCLPPTTTTYPQPLPSTEVLSATINSNAFACDKGGAVRCKEGHQLTHLPRGGEGC